MRERGKRESEREWKRHTDKDVKTGKRGAEGEKDKGDRERVRERDS